MKKSIAMNVVGIVIFALLGFVNLVHSFWTVWLVVEQIETGWGFSTNLELGVLWPWMLELVCSPVLLGGIVYSIVAVFKRPDRWVLITEITLLSLAIVQYFVVNCFIWF